MRKRFFAWKKNFKGSNTQIIKGLEVTKDMIQFQRTKKTVLGKRIRPSVIEPSYGIGRIIYCLLEQSFTSRDDSGEKVFLSLKPFIAPIQCSVFPLLSKDPFISFVEDIAKMLRRSSISAQTDTSGVSIGRKYARVDEIGCPFCITVDHKTLENKTVTVRERNSTEQVRVPIEELVQVIHGLSSVNEDLTWDMMKKKYPIEEVVDTN